MKRILTLTALTFIAQVASPQPFSTAAPVIKHIAEFGAFPNDGINDHSAFVSAAQFFQARWGNGVLMLGEGEYEVGHQAYYHIINGIPNIDNFDPYALHGSSWNNNTCPPYVAYRNLFYLRHCTNFSVVGAAGPEGPLTRIRYKDCLLYGAFELVNDELYRPGLDLNTCAMTCLQDPDIPTLQPPSTWRNAAVGTMFTFYECDRVNLVNLELDGNLDNAIIGQRTSQGGNSAIQTDYMGIRIDRTSRSRITNVHAHHFGQDGLNVHCIIKTEQQAAQVLEPVPGHPHPYIYRDPLDIAQGVPIGLSTLMFDNEVRDCSFNRNARTGIAWTGLAGLLVVDTDLNYNGEAEFWSHTASGLDIEPHGGPGRVHHGTFERVNFLHNRHAGILQMEPCYGDMFFTFRDCLVKAGSSYKALEVTGKGYRFVGSKFFGRIERIYSRPWSISTPEDDSYSWGLDFDAEFENCEFFEEDEHWSYLPEDGDNPPHGMMFPCMTHGVARAAFRHCYFETNCRGKLRFKGQPICAMTGSMCRPITYNACNDCLAENENYVVLESCTFKVNGPFHNPSPQNTPIFDVDRTQTIGTNTLIYPEDVRPFNGVSNFQYEPRISTNPQPVAGCDANAGSIAAYNVILLQNNGQWPDCKPMYPAVAGIDWCTLPMELIEHPCAPSGPKAVNPRSDAGFDLVVQHDVIIFSSEIGACLGTTYRIVTSSGSVAQEGALTNRGAQIPIGGLSVGVYLLLTETGHSKRFYKSAY
jgi:hypothetical protein